VRRVRTIGQAQRGGRGRRRICGTTIERTAGEVPDIGAGWLRLCGAVAEQNDVGPEQGEPADG